MLKITKRIISTTSAVALIASLATSTAHAAVATGSSSIIFVSDATITAVTGMNFGSFSLNDAAVGETATLTIGTPPTMSGTLTSSSSAGRAAGTFSITAGANATLSVAEVAGGDNLIVSLNAFTCKIGNAAPGICAVVAQGSTELKVGATATVVTTSGLTGTLSPTYTVTISYT